ncbi:MAG: DUF5675 family protein [Alistipes indistinctus]
MKYFTNTVEKRAGKSGPAGKRSENHRYSEIAMLISLKRIYFASTYTIGRLSIPSASFECDTLEDTDRDANANGVFDGQEVKINGKTAIPYGRYRIAMTQSPKFSPSLRRPQCPPAAGCASLFRNTYPFGNTPADTEGCILVGENKVKGQVINSRATLFRLLDILDEADSRGEDIYITVRRDCCDLM